MPFNFEMGGEPVDLETLPEREATFEERRTMYGSPAFLYEMKVPILLCVDTGKFYPIDWIEKPVEFNEGRELVILQAPRILESVFRRKHRKPRQIWR
jgi:hypothetical protein